MTSMFDYDDTVNLAFDAKIAGKNLVTAKHELLTKTGEFLFLAHTDKELALRMQMVEADIEKVAHRKLANVSDSKAKLVRAIYDEWQIRHARCEFCSSWSNDTNFTKSAGDEGELSSIRKKELEKVINQDRRMHMNVPQSAIDQLNAPTDSPQEDQTEAAVKSRQNGERQTAKDNEHFGPQPFGTTPGDYVNAPKSTPQKTQPSSNVPSSVEQAVKSRQNGERQTAENDAASSTKATTPANSSTEATTPAKPKTSPAPGSSALNPLEKYTPGAGIVTKPAPGSSALDPLYKYTPGAGIVTKPDTSGGTKPDTSVKTLSNGAGGGNFNYPGAGGAKPTTKPMGGDIDHDNDPGDRTENNPNVGDRRTPAPVAPDKEKGKATSTGPSRGDMTDAAQWISQHSPQSTTSPKSTPTGDTSTGGPGRGGALNAATLADYTSTGGGALNAATLADYTSNQGGGHYTSTGGGHPTPTPTPLNAATINSKPTPTPAPKPYSTMPQTQSTSTGGSQSMTASKIEILRDFLND